MGGVAIDGVWEFGCELGRDCGRSERTSLRYPTVHDVSFHVFIPYMCHLRSSDAFCFLRGNGNLYGT